VGTATRQWQLHYPLVAVSIQPENRQNRTLNREVKPETEHERLPQVGRGGVGSGPLRLWIAISSLFRTNNKPTAPDLYGLVGKVRTTSGSENTTRRTEQGHRPLLLPGGAPL